ncbi:SAM-dependent methyltransferase [Nocardioides sp. Kera G14]|uniref:SAM-dependent methyltransferase n=1 Tax=Nocardioides sp. Kera G14 TaxID=2884264 RepID=UPI001D112977|nr:cyclopropane-fatty-acyl-phospholipid synthase family protein [Nocardioides sp. Kera G14]UDY24030.1 cyclopropane-fatty-acyl-phospholipid synthase family protein [Nocardioides sp. Kera G14]
MTLLAHSSRATSSRPDLHRWPDLALPPSGPRTSLGAALARRFFVWAFSRMPVTVRLHEPGGVRTLGRGGPTMDVLRPDELFARIGRDANIGFGEAYMAGAWEAEDLQAFLHVPASRMDALMPPLVHRLRRLVAPRIGRHQRGGATDTRDNVARHYDLSNGLFEQFLDPTMTYSSGWFRTDREGEPIVGDDLQAAQHRKIDALLDAAGVGDGTRLLEIGTGWGELALRAARRGATVRSLTLSVEQQELARTRIAAAGLLDRVTVDLLDYREVDGLYDAVVSVEMIEAVGWRHWDEYFATIARILAPGGRATIQAITMPHERMLASRDTDTWITRYIFPGGFLPSLEALGDAAGTSGLVMRVNAALGHHYAETLRQWDASFVDHEDAVAALGFDETFRRMWHFYLSYCGAGFDADYIDVHQLVLSREGLR